MAIPHSTSFAFGLTLMHLLQLAHLHAEKAPTKELQKEVCIWNGVRLPVCLRPVGFPGFGRFPALWADGSVGMTEQ